MNPWEQPYTQSPTGVLLFEKKKMLYYLSSVLKVSRAISESWYRQLTKVEANYGVAVVDILGATDPYLNEVLYAHSGVGNPDSKIKSFLTHGVKFVPLSEGTQRFRTLWVKNEEVYNGPLSTEKERAQANKLGYFDRNVCTESKILEYLNARLKTDPEVVGTVHLFTERKPCPSCVKVINDFVAVYTNIRITVFYER